MTAQEEERRARKQHRDLERARRAAKAKREREYREKLRGVVRDTRAKHPRCKCNFHGVKSADELRKMGSGCTDPNYTCPRLVAVRAKMSGS